MQQKTGVLKFSIRVWITNVVMGPLLLLLMLLQKKTAYHGFLLNICFGSMIFGALLSLPGIIVFHFSAAFLFRKNWSLIWKKLVLILQGIIFIVIPLYLVFEKGFQNDPILFKIMVAYSISVITGILIYPLGNHNKAPEVPRVCSDLTRSSTGA